MDDPGGALRESARRLHHIGFVVPEIVSALEGFACSLGASRSGRIFEDPVQKVKVAFLTTGPGEPQIELVEPLGGDSPVWKFLNKGGGLHHFCYETGDLEGELRLMQSRKAMLLKKPQPAVAFGGRRIAWMLTRENLLLEFLEAPSPAART